MKRLVAIAAAAAVIGVVVWRVAGDREDTDSLPAAPAPGELDHVVETTAETPASDLEIELLNLVTRTFGDAERDGVEALARRASAAELESLARFTAALPNLRGKPIALEILLSRYASIDPVAALVLARELKVDRELLDSLQRDGAPNVEAEIDDAASLPPAQRREAFARLAGMAVQQDASAALAHGNRLDDEARAELSAAIFRSWARHDAEQMLRYVSRLGAEAQQAALEAAGLEAFAQLDPARMLEIATLMRGELAQRVRAMALAGLVSRDPLAAVLHVEMMPAGDEQTQLFSVLARGYAAADPQGALAWAEGLQPPQPTAVASVLREIARADPERAVELMLAELSPQQRAMHVQALISSGALNDEQTAALANRWPTTPRGSRELRSFTATWARRSPKQALEWLLANPERAHADAFGQAAESLARVDVPAAEAYMSRIPSDLRPLWLRSVADGYAQMEPAAAARWLGRYADNVGYDAALATVAQRTARTNPAAAARLLADVDVERAAESIDAAGFIATRWAASDAAAARNWALELSPGVLRNAALTPVVAALAGENGAVEPALMAAFTADAAGQSALAEAIMAVARSNARAAQQLSDQYLVDAELRRQVARATRGVP